MAFLFLGGYAFYKLYIELPILFSVSTCVLIYRFGLMLFELKNTLKSLDFSTIPWKCMEIIDTYNKIEEKLYLLTDTLSVPLFIMLLLAFINLHLALGLFIQEGISSPQLPDICLSAFTGVLIICLLTICGSKIPQYILEIKKTVELLISKYEINNLKRDREFRILRRIEKSDVIYLSACGMVHFQKSFLLSAFGAFFTYGLLIEKDE
ncbi:uncharacterized protein NPIL_497791 [Nephila pilipes]|uniref:Uncharacterized protein n=1 Tax=Nephila pilipes TaxID=299642 RepID=A0A8X6QJD3_NEPPI|nr:uncharacterized protein NPIL_144141 [Nephila pilipes]GFU28232.1 uncharacterized protein NPIL_497791 [Nephila pilipes]